MEDNVEDSSISLPGNDFEWRRRLRQKKDSVDTLSYSHWVDFLRGPSGAGRVSDGAPFNCNFHVTTRGAPRVHQNEKSGPCLLRQITISPPVTVRNLLACEIEVKLSSRISSGKVSHHDMGSIYLRPGEVRAVVVPFIQ